MKSPFDRRTERGVISGIVQISPRHAVSAMITYLAGLPDFKAPNVAALHCAAQGAVKQGMN